MENSAFYAFVFDFQSASLQTNRSPRAMPIVIDCRILTAGLAIDHQTAPARPPEEPQRINAFVVFETCIRICQE
jgi:hypothetical protein